MVYQRLRSWGAWLQMRVLPPNCVGCGTSGYRPARPDCPDLCVDCHVLLPINHMACRRCAIPLQTTTQGLLCGACLRRPPAQDAGWCAFHYAWPVAHFVRSLKYGQSLAQARVLGTLLGDHLRTHRSGDWPDCIVPVPLSAQRYRERGYNQAIELGRFVADSLQLPLRTELVMRTRHTIEQSGLDRRARRRNLRHAFAVNATNLPDHIALLDDVITTGSTVNEIARLLKKSGVRQVEVWAVARAMRR